MIKEFRGKYRFLSNFHPVWIDFEGLTYPSLEHAYQAAKTLDYDERLKICEAKSAGDAKRIGNNEIRVRDGWDGLKIVIMESLLHDKFSVPELKEKLLATGEQDLEEGNNHNDRFWGTVDGVGENNLGKLLMLVRSSKGLNKSWFNKHVYSSNIITDFAIKMNGELGGQISVACMGEMLWKVNPKKLEVKAIMDTDRFEEKFDMKVGDWLKEKISGNHSNKMILWKNECIKLCNIGVMMRLSYLDVEIVPEGYIKSVKRMIL